MGDRLIPAAKVAKLAKRMAPKPAVLAQPANRAGGKATVALYGHKPCYEVRVMDGGRVAWSCDVPTMRLGNAIVRAMRALIAEHGTWS